MYFLFSSSPLQHSKALVLQAVKMALSLEKQVPFSIPYFHPCVCCLLHAWLRVCGAMQLTGSPKNWHNAYGRSMIWAQFSHSYTPLQITSGRYVEERKEGRKRRLDSASKTKSLESKAGSGYSDFWKYNKAHFGTWKRWQQTLTLCSSNGKCFTLTSST